METIITKPNADRNGKLAISIVIFVGVLVGMLFFDVLEPTRIQFIDNDRESNKLIFDI